MPCQAAKLGSLMWLSSGSASQAGFTIGLGRLGFEIEHDMQKALYIEQLMSRKGHVKLLVVNYNACTTN